MANPWLPRLGRKLDRFFEQVEREFAEIGAAFDREFTVVDEKTVSSRPGCKVEKVKGQTTILVEVPGCSPQDVQVHLADGIVTVKAPTLNGDRVYQFRVGVKVDASDITATVKDGLLTLLIKRDQQPAPPSGTVKVTG